MSTVVLQTVLDLLMVGGLVIIFLFQVTLPAWWREPGFALLVMVGGAVVLVMVLAIGRHPLLRRLKMVADGRPALPLQRLVSLTEQFLNGFELLGQTRLIGQAFGWSLLIWGFYGTVNYVLMKAIGINPTWTAAFFVLVVLQLGVAIPSSPGRIGVFHYLSVLALTVFAVDEAQAVSYAIMSHFISVILPIIVGLVLAWRMRIYGQEDRR
jgi:uncharacterized protein (TIRG00374 family)